ncbi:MAG: hypothetical protein K8T90_07005 [Planctomycetes bacterium]|nr:hypothetical protein [Planctomycetota bacterium]
MSPSRSPARAMSLSWSTSNRTAFQGFATNVTSAGHGTWTVISPNSSWWSTYEPAGSRSHIFAPSLVSPSDHHSREPSPFAR